MASGQIRSGRRGPSGPAGRAVVSAALNAADPPHLIITYSDGTTTDAGVLPTGDGGGSSSWGDIAGKPAKMSVGEAETGTATTERTVDAATLKAAILEHAPTGGGGGATDMDGITDASATGKAVVRAVDKPAARTAIEAAADAEVVKLSGNQTIGGTKTFSTAPAVPDGSFSAAKVGSGTFDAARIPDLNASKVTAGTLGSARLPAATDAAQGAVELATTTEAATGTDTTRAVTAAGVTAAIVATSVVAVEWNGSAWPAYTTDPDAVRHFYSQDDASADPPTAYNSHDVWYGANV